MTLYAATDGASRGNPGESGIGVIVRNAEGEVVFTISGYIGTATNNIAEYTALLTLLRSDGHGSVYTSGGAGRQRIDGPPGERHL